MIRTATDSTHSYSTHCVGLGETELDAVRLQWRVSIHASPVVQCTQFSMLTLISIPTIPGTPRNAYSKCLLNLSE